MKVNHKLKNNCLKGRRKVSVELIPSIPGPEGEARASSRLQDQASRPEPEDPDKVLHVLLCLWTALDESLSRTSRFNHLDW